jgi:polyisoprenoid-binding protein YceI
VKSVCLILILLAAQAGNGQALDVDEKLSSVRFNIGNFGLDVEGSLGNLRGSVLYDRRNLASSSFRLSADANTIDTGIALRDKHLQKEEYLDAKKYTTLEFTSTSIVTTQTSDEILVSGTLTIKNTTKHIQVPVKVVPSDGRFDFSGTFTINRLEYLVGNSSISLADDVTVTFSIRTLIVP